MNRISQVHGWMLRPRLRWVVPWVGLALVASWTHAPLSYSAALVDGRSQEFALGVPFAALLGYVGLSIVALGLLLRQVRYVPAAALAVSLLYTGSFYGFIGPWSDYHPRHVFYLTPGVTLALLSLALWWRYGLMGNGGRVAVPTQRRVRRII